MKKLLILSIVLVAAYFALAQNVNRVPTPAEERLLSGKLSLLDGHHPHYSISVITAATHTLDTTNSIVFVRSPTPDAINHIIFPDCTNHLGRWYRIIVAGPRNLAVLTNANSQSFEGFTNTVTTAGFSLSSNMVADVVSTGTNWFVTRLQNGNN